VDLNLPYDAQLEACLLKVHGDRVGRHDELSFGSLLSRPILGAEAPHHVVKLPSRHLHVLLGRNGSGKTLLLEALRPDHSATNPLTSTFIFRLPDETTCREWARAATNEMSRLRLLPADDPELDHVPPEYVINADRHVVSRLEATLQGPAPGEYLSQVGMTSGEALEFFGCSASEIDAWSRRWEERHFEEKYGVHLDGWRDIDLRFLESEFVLTALSHLPSNPGQSTIDVPGFLIAPADTWFNDTSRRNLIVPAVQQFLRNATHVETEDEASRLLCPFPEAGPLREFVELVRADTDPNSLALLPFPTGLFQQHSFGGRPFIASFNLDLKAKHLVRVIDVSPGAEHLTLEQSLGELVTSLTSIHAWQSDSTLGLQIDHVDQLELAIRFVSRQVARCDIGVAEVALRWPPDGSTFYKEETSDETVRWGLAGPVPRALPTLKWKDAVSGEWLWLDEASRGQREVISLFVHLADLGFHRSAAAARLHKDRREWRNRHVILVSDEFDRSLHPSASTATLEALAEAVEDMHGVSVVVSTHNVSSLSRASLRGVSRILANRTHDDFQYESSATSSLEVTASILGSSFLDALKLKRLHILVEGNHDELVITRLLENQIPEITDVDIVNGRGVNAWSGIIANSLRFLDAPVLLVHDKKDLELETQWRTLQETFSKTGRLPAWGDTGLSAMLSDLGQRRSEFASRAGDSELERMLWLLRDNVFDADHSQAQRLHIFGLDCDDIVDLLPVTAFPKAKKFTNWSDAHADFRRRSPREGASKFKSEFGINDRTVREALKKSADSVHPELARLVGAVRELLEHGSLPSNSS